MRIVLDTNVLVSALITPDGPAAGVLGLIVAGQVDLLAAPEILTEYHRVLHRERFGFNAADVDAVFDHLTAIAEYPLVSPTAKRLPDPGDVMFLACALAGEADAIVTGNKRHFPAAACRPIPVMSPRELLDTLTGHTDG